jgi:pimeloyl-ACP methyl ester carboxylesterase
MNQDRREFLGMALMTIVAAKLGMTEPRSSFGSVKQIDAGLLNVGYVDDGPANGRPVMLLHGWPYDVHSFEEVAPLLAAKGYRVIVPHLRGYGTTRFLSNVLLAGAGINAAGIRTPVGGSAVRVTSPDPSWRRCRHVTTEGRRDPIRAAIVPTPGRTV